MKSITILILLFISMTALSQLCTGSLGDPVASITFGSGRNPGPPIDPKKTLYSYSSSSCPAEGEYSLLNLTFACFDQTWHTLSGDQTPNDNGGYYMLVNGSQANFYADTIRNLCAGTTYEFSVWVVNMLKQNGCNGISIDPNLNLVVETLSGQVLATTNTGNISKTESPTWKKVGVFFQLPANETNVLIRINNNAAAGCGNDLALDDITIRPCGLPVTASINPSGATALNICEGVSNSVLLSATYSSQYSNPLLQWQEDVNGSGNWTDIPGANSTTYLRLPTANGFYEYRLAIRDGNNPGNLRCGVNSNPVSIQVNPLPNAQVTNYVFGCYGSTVSFIAAGGNSYQWTGPNGFTSTLQSPAISNVQYNNAGTYTVKVTTLQGCSNSASVDLAVYPNVTISSGHNITICEGKQAVLEASGGSSYLWLPADGLSDDKISNPVAKPAQTTTYSAITFNQYGCTDTAKITVTVLQKPVAYAGPDKKTRLGLPVTLSGSVKGEDYRYFWTPSFQLNNPLLLQPRAQPDADMNFILHAESNQGCGSTADTVFVKVFDKLIVPNTFTPNGDGINDTWVIEPLDLFERSVTEVYNRYGQLVYSSRGYPRPWDGNRNGIPMPPGTYYYIINLNNNNEPKLSGSLLLIR